MAPFLQWRTTEVLSKPAGDQVGILLGWRAKRG